MKRTGMKRKPTKRKPPIDELPRLLFHEAGIRQGRCRACPSRARQSHHVVYRQELRARGEGEWSVRNAMGLCVDCHEKHHNRSRPLPLRLLTDDEIAYAFEVLGPAAYDYLRRRYGGADMRLESRLVPA